jgi:hypothetical protein
LNGKEIDMKIGAPQLSRDKKLYEASEVMIKAMRDADMKPDEVLNVLLNLLARSAVLACVDKAIILEGLASAYDMHIADDSSNETFN